MSTPIAYLARLQVALSKLGQSNGTAPPQDPSNESAELAQALAEAFMWKETEKYAKAKYERAMIKLAAHYKVPAFAGKYDCICESQHFAMSVTISQPVQSFDADELAKLLSRGKYKIPTHYTKEMVDKAKVPGSSRHTYKITEKLP